MDYGGAGAGSRLPSHLSSAVRPGATAGNLTDLPRLGLLLCKALIDVPPCSRILLSLREENDTGLRAFLMRTI